MGDNQSTSTFGAAAGPLDDDFFKSFLYAYPAPSRRFGGISIGINLSPTRLCNFSCVYCEVKYFGRPRPEICDGARLDVARLKRELKTFAELTLSGELFKVERFAKLAPEKRRLSGFTFCGDGEPTLSPDFGATVDAAIEARADVGREDLGLALITNSTRLTAPDILPALDRFVAAGGEIWAKLDAGTPERYRAINRSAVPFEKILENIRFAAARWGVKIQTAALEWDGEKPTDAGVRAYCAAVREIAAAGRVSEIQFYTVARVPQDARAIALSNAEMDALAAEIRAQTGLDVPVFYSS